MSSIIPRDVTTVGIENVRAQLLEVMETFLERVTRLGERAEVRVDNFNAHELHSRIMLITSSCAVVMRFLQREATLPDSDPGDGPEL